MIFSGDEMIFQAFSVKTIHINLFFDQKTNGAHGPAHGTQWPGQWYSKVRPMGHKRTTHEPHPYPHWLFLSASL